MKSFLALVLSLVVSSSAFAADSLEQRVANLEQKVLKLEAGPVGQGKLYTNLKGATRYSIGNNCADFKPANFTENSQWLLYYVREVTCGQDTFIVLLFDNDGALGSAVGFKKQDVVELN